MIDLSSLFASSLKSFGNAVRKRVSRLRNERQAGLTLGIESTDMMDQIFNSTLNRLRGGGAEDNWLQNILNRLEKPYISPEFLKKPALQKWLFDEHTVADLKILSRARLITGIEDDVKIRNRLAESYSKITGEDKRFAEKPINVILNILVAGCKSSISPDQYALVGMIQAHARNTVVRNEAQETFIPNVISDPITQKAHTDEANTALSKIVQLRLINPGKSRVDIQALLNRIRDGDLASTNTATKAKIWYWAARLYAVEATTLKTARQLYEELKNIDSEIDTTIIDALIAETTGNPDGALRLIRDHDDVESRSVFFAILARSQGEHAALKWSKKQNDWENPAFFTGGGWFNWVACSTRIGNWEEASWQLAKLKTLWKETPLLAFVEGKVNAIMLFPHEYRGEITDYAPLYQGVNTSQTSKAAEYHARATTCFEFLSSEDYSDIFGSKFTKMIFRLVPMASSSRSRCK